MSFRRGGGRGGAAALPFPTGDVIPDDTPDDLYPKTILPAPQAPSDRERQAVSQYLALKEDIRNGPLFTGSSTASARVVVEIEEGFNDGIKRFSDIYIKKRKIGRSVDEHPYVVEFFPPELHAAMGVNAGKRKKLDISRFTAELRDAGTDKDKEKMLELKLAGDGDDKADAKEKSDVSDDEEEEDELDDDDDDDYNAEKYFDDGDDFGGEDSGDDDPAY